MLVKTSSHEEIDSDEEEVSLLVSVVESLAVEEVVEVSLLVSVVESFAVEEVVAVSEEVASLFPVRVLVNIPVLVLV